MKKIIICLVAVLLFAGCDSLIEPNHIKDPEMLGWVYRDCISESVADTILNRFVSGVRNQTISVNGFESIGPFENLVIDYFKNQMDGCGQPINTENLEFWDYDIYHTFNKDKPAPTLEVYMEKHKNQFDFEYVFLSPEPKELCYQNRKKSQNLCSELIKEYFAAFEREAQGQFKVLSWDYDKGAQGDSYTGYLIEYEIGEGYYVLLSLIEYDKTNRYKADIIYKGSSLQELNNCYE
ncbi:MAG: hypothetical protein IJR34_05180 [Bacteroidales bacterium]|nr:hypothetical protein [Bacteroidales bacterium]